MSVPAGSVLVLGSDTRSLLAVIRSLGRAGLAVHVTWCPAEVPALRSRYVRAEHGIPAFDVDAFARLLQRQPFDLVIPCDDSVIAPIQANRTRLEAYAQIALLSDDAYAVCSDKSRTYELAERLDIPLAPQKRITSADEIEDVARCFGWPLVLKPLRSVTAARPGVHNAVRKARSRADIGAIDEPVLVQQNFIGVGMGVEVLCLDGDVLLAFQHDRVHEPMPGGGSSYRRSVPLTPDLLDAARRLMRAMRYTGVGMIEFKVNPRTGAWILIEINGRFWGSLPLSIAAGADFPRYLYEMLVYGRVEFPQHYTCGVYARNWMLDVRWLARNFLTDRRDPTLMTRPLWKVALEVLNLPREHSDTLTLDDPAPAWAEITQSVERATQPLRARLPW